MSLRRLQVTDFRCLQSVHADLHPRFTLISGPNASGKTSLLEAIYVLGRGRSFRTRLAEPLIRRGAEQFVVFGEAIQGQVATPIGVEARRTLHGAGIRAKIGGLPVRSVADLSANLPVQIIDPEVHQLIEAGPSRRRRYLDWGVFHVEPGFIHHWQRYQRALQQRNAALKAQQSAAVIDAWDHELIPHGSAITAARSRYVELLQGVAKVQCARLFGRNLTLHYRAGWPQGQSFEDALRRSRSVELDRGSTQVGPHRGELTIRIDGLTARDHVSRGQQKLLAAAMLIAQIQLFPMDAPSRPLLMLDDPAAELDDHGLAALIQAVSDQDCQLIITTLHAEFAAFGAPGQRISLDNGGLRAN